MKNLDFIVGEFHHGLNVTVRRGYKWADAKLSELYPITITGIDTDTCAYIVEFKVKHFIDIADDELLDEHDVSCVTWGGLLKAMLQAYPDFKISEPVVLLGFYVVGKPV